MERTQFTFYESFYKAISRMKSNASKAATLDVMARLALYGEEPDMDKIPNEAASALEVIIPIIRSGNNKAANRIKQEQTKTNENKTEQTDNKNKNKSKSKYKNNSYKENIKERYGEYNNVLLTAEEVEKLKADYPDWEKRIERLSGYIASKGDHYKSHYATIRNWASKDGVTALSKSPSKPSITGTDEIRELLGRM